MGSINRSAARNKWGIQLNNEAKWLCLRDIVSFNPLCCLRNSLEQCSQFCGSSLLGAEVALRSCCYSSCLWCIFLINYLNNIHTISAPIMQRFSIKCQQFSPLIKFIQSVASLLSVALLRRSQCSPGLTTWRTRSCWTWFLCSRASAKRKMFTVSYRVWGTGSRQTRAPRLGLRRAEASPRCDGPSNPAPALRSGLGVSAGPRGLFVLVIIKPRDNNCMQSTISAFWDSLYRTPTDKRFYSCMYILYVSKSKTYIE